MDLPRFISSRPYGALVAGGGAAGIAAVGALLHFNRSMRIAWIDPDFQGGRISQRYRDVSSNTKVKLFKDYADALEPFQTITKAYPKPNAMTDLASLDQDKGCRLDYAANMLQMLTAGLCSSPNVHPFRGNVTHAVRHNLGGNSPSRPTDRNHWTTQLSFAPHTPDSAHEISGFEDTSNAISAERLVLATGSSPSSMPLPTSKPTQLDLDECLDRSALRDLLPSDRPCTVGVIGTSHSGVVLLMNLYELATTTHRHLRMRWFVRSELTYAQEMDGWILRDNTGLKGASAEFARRHLEPEKLKESDVGRYLEQVHCPDARDEGMRGELERCDFVVQAIGFKKDGLPRLTRGGEDVREVGYDALSGRLLDGEGRVLEGAFGAGIAFPEKVTDPYGNVEYAVGLWKFMRYLKRAVPGWVSDPTGKGGDEAVQARL